MLICPATGFIYMPMKASDAIRFTNNWTPTTKYLQNANGPDNLWDNNGPQAGDSIKQNAGIQMPYQYLLAG